MLFVNMLLFVRTTLPRPLPAREGGQMEILDIVKVPRRCSHSCLGERVTVLVVDGKFCE